MARIGSVEAIGLEAPVEEPFGYAQGWVDTRSATLVRVRADDGTVGWGECWGPVAGTRETVEGFLAPLVEGADPTAPADLYDRLHAAGRRAYQSVVPLPAISGVDIAVHDLAGKLAGVPVAELLGERRRESVSAYATGHYFRRGLDLEAQYDRVTAEAERNAARLGAVKLKTGLQLLGYGPGEDVELVRRVRAALPETTLLVDANYAYDLETALEVGRDLADLDVDWFEEPVAPDALDGYATLADRLAVRIAGGECHRPAELDRLLSMGALDVVQPDVCNVGGLTPARRVADTADRRSRSGGRVQVVPHVWGTPVALAASLQLIATLSGDPSLEFDRSPNPLREALAVEPVEPDAEGRVAVPDAPGLGVELDPDAVERYRV